MRTLDHLALYIATLGPIGRLPRMPGTWGSLFAAFIAPWAFVPFGWTLRLAILAALFLLGTWAAHQAERILEQHDPPSVVIDELVGQWITLLPLVDPATPWEVLTGLALFRLFDMIKPWPISTLDRLVPGGPGAMLDDAAAGLAAAAVLYLVLLF
jgi:phosphatidylglycerophosphatase A